MIVVDMSALMAILLDEPEATACMNAPSTADTLSIWAGTVAEALIVADRRGCGQEMRRLIDGLASMFRPSRQPRRAVADAYVRRGEGISPAGLNFGDCFAYTLANKTASPALVCRRRLFCDGSALCNAGTKKIEKLIARALPLDAVLK